MLVIILHGLFIISVVLGQVSSTKTTDKTVFSLFTKPASWNTANYVCQSIGGKLITIDSEVKDGILEDFKAQEPWKSELRNLWAYWGYWIGLFEDDVPNGRYRWSGDCAEIDNWSNWYTGQPNNADTYHCVLGWSSTGVWYDGRCSWSQPFICESVTSGVCTYDDDVRVCYEATVNTSHIPTRLIDNSITPKDTCFPYKHSSEGTTPSCPESSTSPVAHTTSTTEQSSPATTTDTVTTTHQAIKTSTSVETTDVTTDVGTMTPSKSPTSGGATTALDSPTTEKATTPSESSAEYAPMPSISVTNEEATTSSNSPTTGKATIIPKSQATDEALTTARNVAIEKSSEPTTDVTGATITTTQQATTSTNDDATTTYYSLTSQVTTTTRSTGSNEESPESTKGTTDPTRVDVSDKPDPSASIRTTMKTVFTLYEEEATWNQANKMCQQSHGILLMVDSADKDTIVDYFQEQEPWKSKLDQAYWIGMFDRDPPNETFTWAVGCNRTVMDAHWTNWGDREPDRPNLENCVSQEEYYSEWKWTTKKCQKTYQFICESHPRGNCTFKNYTDKAFQLPGNHTLQCNLTECQAVCGNDGGGDECWAYMYNTTSRGCTLFFASNPVAMMNSSLRVDSNGTIAGVRICYEATTNSSNIKETKHPNPCPEKDPPCRPMPPKMTKAESDAFMKPILDSLDVKHLYNNRKKRKYYSAPDFRPSAKGLGYAGIMLLSIVVGMIVLMDVPRLYEDARMAIHRLRELLPRNRVGDAPA